MASRIWCVFSGTISMSHALSGLIIGGITPQGVALGWYVMPFQGKWFAKNRMVLPMTANDGWNSYPPNMLEEYFIHIS